MSQSAEGFQFNYRNKVTLTPRFIKTRNQLFTRKDRDVMRLALVKQLLEYTVDGIDDERIDHLELLIQKFNDGKTFK